MVCQHIFHQHYYFIGVPNFPRHTHDFIIYICSYDHLYAYDTHTDIYMIYIYISHINYVHT